MAVCIDVFYRYKDDINVICKMLAVKHGEVELDMFSNRFWMLLSSFYTLLSFTVCLYVCTL